MPATTLKSYRIWSREHDGPGPALVFLHGAGGSSLSWIIQYRHFRNRYRVIQLDLPGHGRSTGCAMKSLADYAEAVGGFLDAKKVSGSVIIGHSMGGGIALELALARPDLVSGLVLVATGARLTLSGQVLDTVKRSPSSLPDLLARWICAKDADPAIVARSKAMLEQAGPEVLAVDLTACHEFDSRQRLQAIERETLIVAGTEDKMTGRVSADELALCLGGHVQVVFVPGAGHMVMVEKPAEFNRILDDYVIRISGPGGRS